MATVALSPAGVAPEQPLIPPSFSLPQSRPEEQATWAEGAAHSVPTECGHAVAWTTVESIWQSIKATMTFRSDAKDISSGKIPKYVFEYAPYVHLFSGENFWPCDIADHLVHTTPHINYEPIKGMEHDRTVDNLDELNEFGKNTFLQSDDNVEERPDWLGGARNIPSGDTGSTNRTGDSGYSSAPAVLVVIPKPGGIVDAFWFYFYSYNLGNKVLDIRFGNHVGDWEHTLVRFKHGKPHQVFLSEHNFGQAYAFSAMEKLGKRPLTFSATGSHAMYATPGSHPYVLPLGLLHDQTDRGPLWDPSRNVYAYTLDQEGVFRASRQTPDAPTHWFAFRGHWGDRAYPMNDSRQYGLGGMCHYVNGPYGPIYKNLMRKQVCQSWGTCRIRYWLPSEGEMEIWPGGDTENDDLMFAGNLDFMAFA